MTLEDMQPHYLNDFLLNRFREQGTFANWEVNYNPFEGGSDHVPFLEAKIPGALLWHFTDQFYHTDNDRIDKVSKITQQNVATAALSAALMLVKANEATAMQVLAETRQAAIDRLTAESELSRQSVAAGNDKATELTILKAWADWYVAAVEKVEDLETGGPSVNLIREVKKVQEEIKNLSQEHFGQLDN